MKIEILQTVEQPVVYPLAASGPGLLNEIAQRGAYETARAVDEEAEVVKSVWKFPAGSHIDVPAKAANALLDLGYAQAVADGAGA